MALPDFYAPDVAGIHVDGGFIPLAYAGDVEGERAPDPVEWVSDEGGRTLYVPPAHSRSWAVSTTVPRSWARQAGRVRSGAFGYGPWVFVDPEALRTNALRAGFPVKTSSVLMWDGEIVPVAVTSDARTSSGGIIPGRQYTGSAVTAGAGTLALEFLTASGAVAATATASSGSVLGRPAVTATAPANAAQARIRVTAAGSMLAGGPQVVLGTAPGPLSEPAGIGKVGIKWAPNTWSHLSAEDTHVGLKFTAMEVVDDG